MIEIFSDRIKKVPKSFIREILKVASDPNVISFAGGLPNPDFFPVKELQKATEKVLKNNGSEALQYSTTEGYKLLREYIAKRYKEKFDLDINPDLIIITNGSQQGLDLIGKVFINEGDKVAMEKPGYLGAIQAMSLYNPEFIGIPLEGDGINLSEAEKIFSGKDVKLFYGIPNFQNPSGVSYSEEKREKLMEILKKNYVLAVEDNPYGDIRFLGEDKKSFRKYYENTILLGTFSKTVVPSFRLGWMVIPEKLHDKILIAKQASDLHTNYFSQRILYQYLVDNDLDRHIEKIKGQYLKQRETMVNAIKEHFPENVNFTEPEGGMFLWITLPEYMSSRDLFDNCIKRGVAFVPGDPFYIKGDIEKNTFRLNFSNVEGKKIEEGIKIIAEEIKKYNS